MLPFGSLNGPPAPGVGQQTQSGRGGAERRFGAHRGRDVGERDGKAVVDADRDRAEGCVDSFVAVGEGPLPRGARRDDPDVCVEEAVDPVSRHFVQQAASDERFWRASDEGTRGGVRVEPFEVGDRRARCPGGGLPRRRIAPVPDGAEEHEAVRGRVVECVQVGDGDVGEVCARVTERDGVGGEGVA